MKTEASNVYKRRLPTQCARNDLARIKLQADIFIILLTLTLTLTLKLTLTLTPHPNPNKTCGYIYHSTSAPCDSNPLGTIAGSVRASQARTFAVGLVRTEGPPGFAVLAHVSSIRGATAAGLGRAVRTLAHVRCKCTCETLREQTQTTIMIGSLRLGSNQT